jgi:hypothetical protein
MEQRKLSVVSFTDVLEEALPLFSDENNKSNGARGGVVG